MASHQGVLSSGCQQGGLSARGPLIRVSSVWSFIGVSLGRSFTRVVSHQGGQRDLSSEWSFIRGRGVSHQGASYQDVISVVFHRGVIGEVTLMGVVFHQGGSKQVGLSSGWSLIRVVSDREIHCPMTGIGDNSWVDLKGTATKAGEPEMVEMCRYFHLRVSCGRSINSYATEVLFVLFCFQSEAVHDAAMSVPPLPMENRRKQSWLITWWTRLQSMPDVHDDTSLVKMAAFTAVWSDFKRSFSETGS